MSTPATTTPNANETALHSALAAHPGSTASLLAYIAEMSVSTARSILSRWAANGTAVRTDDPDSPRTGYRWTLATDADATPATAPPAPEPTPRDGDTDVPAPGRGESAGADADPQATDAPPVSESTPIPADAPDAPQPAHGTAPVAANDAGTAAESDSTPAGQAKPEKEKLPPGGLRGMVEDFLRDNPGQDFSPTALKHRLDEIHERNLSSGAINNALEKLTAMGVARRTSNTPKKWALADGA